MAFSNEIKTILTLKDEDWKKAIKSIGEAEKLYYGEAKQNTEKLIQSKEDLLRLEKQKASELKTINEKIAKTEAKLAKARKKNLDDRIKSFSKKLKLQKQQRIEINATSKVEIDSAKQTVKEINNKISAQESYNAVLKKAKANFDEVKKSQDAHTESTVKGKKDTDSMTNSVVRHLRQIETLVVAYYTLSRGFQATIGVGIQVNKMIEDNTMGISALLSANTQMILSNGKAVTSFEKFQIGQKYATETMEDLRKASVKTYATFPQLTEIFQQAIGQTLSMGDSFGTTVDEINKNTIKLAQRMSNIGGAIGQPMDRIREEIRSLLSGNASTDSLIATMIFGSPGEANKAIRLAKERGERGVTELLDKMLSPFDALEGVETYTRSTLKLQDAWQNLQRTLSKPLFETLTSVFSDMADNINDFTENLDNLSKSLETAQKNIKSFANFATAGIFGGASIPLSTTVGLDPKQIKEALDKAKEELKKAKRDLQSTSALERTGIALGFGDAIQAEDKNKVAAIQARVNKLQKEYNNLLKQGKIISEDQLKNIQDQGKLLSDIGFPKTLLEDSEKILKSESTLSKLIKERKEQQKKIIQAENAISKLKDGQTEKEKELKNVISKAKEALASQDKQIAEEKIKIANREIEKQIKSLKIQAELEKAIALVNNTEQNKVQILEDELSIIDEQIYKNADIIASENTLIALATQRLKKEAEITSEKAKQEKKWLKQEQKEYESLFNIDKGELGSVSSYNELNDIYEDYVDVLENHPEEMEKVNTWHEKQLKTLNENLINKWDRTNKSFLYELQDIIEGTFRSSIRGALRGDGNFGSLLLGGLKSGVTDIALQGVEDSIMEAFSPSIGAIRNVITGSGNLQDLTGALTQLGSIGLGAIYSPVATGGAYGASALANLGYAGAGGTLANFTAGMASLNPVFAQNMGAMSLTQAGSTGAFTANTATSAGMGTAYNAGAILGGAGTGYGVGSIANMVAGVDSRADVGGLIGGAIGTSVAGPLGTAIGSALGTAIGGAFGGKTRMTSTGIDVDTQATMSNFVDVVEVFETYKKSNLWKSKTWTENVEMTDELADYIQGIFASVNNVSNLFDGDELVLGSGKIQMNQIGDTISKFIISEIIGYDIGESLEASDFAEQEHNALLNTVNELFGDWEDIAKEIDKTVIDVISDSIATYQATLREFDLYNASDFVKLQLKSIFTQQDYETVASSIGEDFASITVDNFNQKYEDALREDFSKETIDRWESLADVLMSATEASKAFENAIIQQQNTIKSMIRTTTLTLYSEGSTSAKYSLDYANEDLETIRELTGLYSVTLDNFNDSLKGALDDIDDDDYEAIDKVKNNYLDLQNALIKSYNAGKTYVSALAQEAEARRATQQEIQRQIEIEAERARELEQSRLDAILSQRNSLELTYLNLIGDTAEIRRRELLAIDESNRALQQKIWSYQDETQAIKEQNDLYNDRRSLWLLEKKEQQAILDESANKVNNFNDAWWNFIESLHDSIYDLQSADYTIGELNRDLKANITSLENANTAEDVSKYGSDVLSISSKILENENYSSKAELDFERAKTINLLKDIDLPELETDIDYLKKIYDALGGDTPYLAAGLNGAITFDGVSSANLTALIDGTWTNDITLPSVLIDSGYILDDDGTINPDIVSAFTIKDVNGYTDKNIEVNASNLFDDDGKPVQIDIKTSDLFNADGTAKKQITIDTTGVFDDSGNPVNQITIDTTDILDDEKNIKGNIVSAFTIKDTDGFTSKTIDIVNSSNLDLSNISIDFGSENKEDLIKLGNNDFKIDVGDLKPEDMANLAKAGGTIKIEMGDKLSPEDLTNITSFLDVFDGDKDATKTVTLNTNGTHTVSWDFIGDDAIDLSATLDSSGTVLKVEGANGEALATETTLKEFFGSDGLDFEDIYFGSGGMSQEQMKVFAKDILGVNRLSTAEKIADSMSDLLYASETGDVFSALESIASRLDGEKEYDLLNKAISKTGDYEEIFTGITKSIEDQYGLLFDKEQGTFVGSRGDVNKLSTDVKTINLDKPRKKLGILGVIDISPLLPNSAFINKTDDGVNIFDKMLKQVYGYDSSTKYDESKKIRTKLGNFTIAEFVYQIMQHPRYDSMNDEARRSTMEYYYRDFSKAGVSEVQKIYDNYNYDWGFRNGGYTGDMSPNSIAGVVHGQEYVINAPTVKDLGINNSGGVFKQMAKELQSIREENRQMKNFMVKLTANSTKQLNTQRGILDSNITLEEKIA
jgi:hypothetical protein